MSTGGLALLILLAMANPLEEFKPAPPAPATPYKGEVPNWAKDSQAFYIAEVNGYPEYHVIEESAGQRTLRYTRPDRMRRLEALYAAHQYFLPSDPAMAQRLAKPEAPSLHANFMLVVDASGRPTVCGAANEQNRNPDLDLITRQCPLLVQRMRFRPALDLNGKPATDRYFISINFSRRYAYSNEGNFAVRAATFAPMPPPPPPRLTLPSSWPVRHGMLRGYGRFPSIQGPLLFGAAAGSIAANEPVVGVTISAQEDGNPRCDAVTGPADVKVRDAACRYVIEKLKPAWPVTIPTRDRDEYPLLIVGEGRKLRAIAPLRDRPMVNPNWTGSSAVDSLSLVESAMQTGGSMDNLRLWLTLNAAGSASDCKIHKSSGSDADDFAACQALVMLAKFGVPLDIFGQPLPVSELYWQAATARQFVKAP